MNQNKLVPKLVFKVDRDKEYKMEVIQDSSVYTNKAGDQLPELYYLIFWKGYLKAENTYKSDLVVIHF